MRSTVGEAVVAQAHRVLAGAQAAQRRRRALAGRRAVDEHLGAGRLGDHDEQRRPAGAWRAISTPAVTPSRSSAKPSDSHHAGERGSAARDAPSVTVGALEARRALLDGGHERARQLRASTGSDRRASWRARA